MALKITDPVVFFVPVGDRSLAGGYLAPVTQKGFVRDNSNNDERIQLQASYPEEGQSIYYTAVPHALNMVDAVNNGYRWMTVAEAEAVDPDILSNPNFDFSSWIIPQE